MHFTTAFQYQSHPGTRAHNNLPASLFVQAKIENNEDSTTKDVSPFYMKISTNIITKVDENVYLKSACGVVIPFIAALYSTTITCWPQHDVILNPEYWYEPLAPTVVSNILIATPAQLIGCSLVMNINFLLSTKNFLVMFLSEAFGFLTSYVLIHLVWVYVVEYPHPMPFIGQLCWIIGTLMSYILASKNLFNYEMNQRGNFGIR